MLANSKSPLRNPLSIVAKRLTRRTNKNRASGKRRQRPEQAFS
jgi:hypothetical protein